MFSRADMLCTRLKDWKMNPILSRRNTANWFSSIWSSLCPSTQISPAVGRSSPPSR